MGETDLDIVGKKKSRQNITNSLTLNEMEEARKGNMMMNGDQKTICVVAICVALVAICVVCCLTYYELTTFQQAVEAGLEQQYGTNGTTIWVKAPIK